MKNNIRQNKGITLIALVITIIVLLLLAGVAIASLTGENGLLNRATGARDEMILGEAREKIKLAGMEAYTSGAGTITYDTLVAALNNNFEGNGTGVNQYEIVEGDNSTTTWKVRAHTSAGNVDEVLNSDGQTETETDDTYQWRLVADSDNSGTISRGDELAPTNNSIKDEHFLVTMVDGNRVDLITKYSVDPTLVSQSQDADDVPYSETKASPLPSYYANTSDDNSSDDNSSDDNSSDDNSSDDNSSDDNSENYNSTLADLYQQKLVNAGISMLRGRDFIIRL